MASYLKNFGFSHKSGILLSVSSLPSPYGIGSLGQTALDFIDFLAETGQTCWQVLPLNPTSYGDSPYQSLSSAAGNPYFIDLPLLLQAGLLTEQELRDAEHDTLRVDYGWLFQTRFPLLRKAHSRFHANADFKDFCESQKHWLEDYALFMALKIHHGHRPWVSWESKYRDVIQARHHAADFAEEMDFWRWVQFTFRCQWDAVHCYAREKGIFIIGDIPIYAAHDSADVWQAPENFLLTLDGNPRIVAGFPPDGFSPDGQLWGNPIYNWEYIAQNGFRWWIDRLGGCFQLYDILRIDHFIGFENYYAVPYPSATAKGGKWYKAPGKALFSAVKAALPGKKIIAEDLGIVTEDVRQLLAFTGFPGMKMLHFAFYEDDSENLPRMYTSDNWVVYTASHDSDCTYSWAQGLDKTALARFRKECPVTPGQTIVEALIAFAMNSRANLAMVPMQDYLELDNASGRMNVPSVAHGNWGWRLAPDYATPELTEKITHVTTACKRSAT